MKERLSKYLSRCGVASRRKAEAIIRGGRVSVNNSIVLEPYSEIDPRSDVVTVDSLFISDQQPTVYVALHKPRRFISDLSDPRGRLLARDLIDISARIYPVGRLDYDSEGLIIFTNDGEFAQKVLHPRNGIEKEYLVKLQGQIGPKEIGGLTGGRSIEGVNYKLESVKLVRSTAKNAWYRMIAKEGRNRMVRKLASSVGHDVLRLKRVRIGPIALGTLKSGKYRFLTSDEIQRILNSGKGSG